MPTFASLDLPDSLLQGVEALGYTQPTPVQARGIPLVMAGHDVSVQAPTGSGKTAAFALPLLAKRLGHRSSDRPSILVLVPTRELAIQVAGAFSGLARFSPQAQRVVAIIGGQPIEGQIQALGRGVDIVVATPGRLLDLIRREDVDLSRVHSLVLDEADKLLDAGFAEELETLLAALPATRQTLLFSATLSDSVGALAARLQNDPVTLTVDPTQASAPDIQQRVFLVPAELRRGLLQHLFAGESWGQTLVFVATQRAAHNLAAKLRTAGLAAGALHGGLEQADRLDMLRRFRAKSITLLIATDLAARGIDIPRLDVVVNLDLPRSPRDYLHRIGRTGRAGAAGIAVSFIDHATAPHFALIEKRAGIQLQRLHAPGFELLGEAPERTKGPAPTKGKRKSKKDKLREQSARMPELDR